MAFRILRSMATMSRNVVVALDSSGPSSAAMKWAVKNFKAPDTQFHFVRCFEPLMTYASDEFTFVPTAEDQTKYVNAHHKEIDATIKSSVPANEKVNYQKHLVEGDPRNVLCEMASALKADAVVLGSHGKGVVKRALLGSVSNHVAQHATVPVVIVRGENAPDV